MKFIFFILTFILLVSCVSNEKEKPRHPLEQMHIGDPAQKQKDELEKINQSRKAGNLGFGMVSEPCQKATINPLEIVAQEVSDCKDTYQLRLKFNCKFEMGMPEPYMKPLRYKEIELEVVSSSEPLNKFFPKKLFTDASGVVETFFKLRNSPKDFRFATKRNGQRYEIKEINADIVLPESLCVDK